MTLIRSKDIFTFEPDIQEDPEIRRFNRIIEELQSAKAAPTPAPSELTDEEEAQFESILSGLQPPPVSASPPPAPEPQPEADERFDVFKSGIAFLETGGLREGERNVRTAYSGGKGSSAFGVYQITRGRVEDMLKDAGVSVSVSKGDPSENFGRKKVSFKYNKKRDKGGYSPEEVSSLKRLYDEQTEALRIGGRDREKTQKKFGFSDEYADAYDYSISSKERQRELRENPSAPLRRGTFRLTTEEVANIKSASEKELRRHYEKHSGRKSPVEIAKMWHGGDDYKRKGDDPTETSKYGKRFDEFIKDYENRKGFELFDIGYQRGGLVDPRSGFDFVRAPEGAREEDYDLYQTPRGNVFGVPKGTSHEQAALLGFNQYQDDYLSLFAQPEEVDQEPEEDPGLIERFGGELAAAFREQMTSAPGAFQMTMGDILDDEELYKKGLTTAEEASRKAAEYTPFQRIGFASGEESVVDTFEQEGFFPGAYKGAEYVAQTLGQTVGYVAPAALARFATGALATTSLASLPITGTIAGISLLGGAAFLTYSNLLSNQLERNAQVARREGRDPNTDDFNIANQMLAAAGQTALETLVPAAVARSLPRGATGLGNKRLTDAIADAGKSAGVRNASNTAAAQTALQAVKTSSGARAAKIGATMGAEGATEFGQSLIERAAAGETIDLSNQEAFDEAIESFVAGMVGGSLFGATGQAIDYSKERKSEKDRIEKEAKEEAASAEEQVDIADSAQETSPESEKILEANRILEQNAKDAERIQQISTLQEKLSAEAQLGVDALNEEADAKAREQAESLAVQFRTVDDVLNVARDRNIDIDSSQSASDGFSRLIFDATSRARKAKGEKPIYSLEDATPNQVDVVYSAIESLPSQAELTSIPTISLSESISIASKDKKKLAGNKTKEQLISSVKPSVKKTLGKNAPDAIVDNAAKTVVDNLISNGVINSVTLDAPTTKKKVAFIGEVDVYDSGQPAQALFPGQRKPRKKKIKRYTLSQKADIDSLLDSDFRSVSDAILSLAKANESTVKDSDNSVRNLSGAYPSYKNASQALPGLDKETYDKAKKLHQDLGIVTEGKSPKIISREDSPVNRIAYEADQKPQTRWVIRNQDGGFVRAEPSKSKSDKFIQGNQGKSLAAPQRERGYAVREIQYREGPTGQETVSQSRVVNFVPTDVYEETVKPSKFVTDEEAHDAAMSQRGEPEWVMDDITAQNNPGFPAKLTDLLMHVGDLSHRAQEMKGYGVLPLTEKINYILRHDHSFNRQTIREEIEEGRVFNAKYNLLSKIPEFVRLDRGPRVNGDPAWKAAGYRTRSEFFNDFLKNISEAEIQQEVQRGRDAEAEPLARYISAHQNYNNPVTEMGQLGKEMAIDLAEGKYEVVYEKAKEIRSFLDKYADLESQGKAAQAEKLRLRRAKPPATKPLLRSMQGSEIAFDAQLDAQIDARERADALAESVTRYFGTTQSQAPNVTPQLLRAIEATRAKRKRGLKEAAQIFREPAFSLRKVFNSYAMPIEQGSPAFDTVNESENWSIPFDVSSNKISSNVPVVVKEGKIIRSNGRGFGRQKLQVREGQISRNTPYSNYIEALNGFFDRIRTNPKVLSSPEVTVFAEGPGRSVAIWNSPAFKEPMTIVMDYVEDSDAGDYYSVFDIFVGDDYGAQVENIEVKKSVPPKRGRNVSTQAVFAAENPDNAKKLAVGDKDAQGISISQIEVDAKGLKVAEPKEKKGLLKYINNLLESTLGAERVSKIQRAAFDQWDSWVLAEQKLANEALGRVMFADQSAVSMARNIDNLFPMFTESLSKGFIKYADGVLSIERLALDNETGDIQYFDPDSRTVKSGRFSSNMFNEENENSEGGFVTILAALQDANKNSIGSVFDYGRALRSYRIMKENLSRPAKEKVRTPYDNDKALLQEHLSIPFYNPKVAVAHHNIQKWNGNTVQFLVDTGVLDEEEAVFWLDHSDYIPFYLNLDHETNSMLEREWNSFQANRGKKTRVYNPLTYNDPTKKLEKGSEDLADPLESYLRNAMGALTAGAVNVARSRAIRNAIANDTARRVNRNDRANPNIVRVREGGGDIFFEVDDAVELELSALVEADPLADMFSNDLARKIFANPARFLRETVTRDPGFALANLIRDSMIVWMINPSLKGYMKGEVGLGLLPSAIKRAFDSSSNPQREALAESGMVSGPRSSTMIDSNYYIFDKTERAARDIKQRIEGDTNTDGKFLSKPLTPIVSLWNALGDLSNRSETATREIVYEHVFNTTRERLKKNSATEMLPNETTEQFESRITRIAQAEAIEQAREILNFNRRGSNMYLQKALSVTPFFNASMQGLNVMFRGMTGIRPVGINREAGPDAVFNSLARRGARIAAASVALELAMMAAEDEDYEEQDEYVKNNYWLLRIPGFGGFLGIPSPFEYGFIFKTLPQIMTRALVDELSGDMSNEQRSVYKASLAALAAATPDLPPVLKLGKMYLTNRSAFGDIPIDYQYERDTGVPSEERVGPRTTAQAQMIGEVVGPVGRFFGMENLSPKFIDASVRALAGGLAMDAWNGVDFLARMPALVSSSYPFRVRPRARIERLPILDRFVYDNIGNYDVSNFYDYRNEILNVERRIRNLYASGRSEQAERIIEDNKDLLALSGPSKEVYSALKQIGAEIREIESGEAEMGMMEGRERVTELEMLRREPLRYWKSLVARSRKEFN